MEFEKFVEEYYKISGVNLNHYHWDQLERRLRSFLSNYFELEKSNNNNFYLAIEELKNNKKFRVEIYEALTINHSYFFRNFNQIEFLLEKIKKSDKKNLKIWSAGCSSGEEPYTIAMLMKELHPEKNIKIFASDIDEKILDRAQEGLYERFSLERELPENYKIKYFSKKGDLYKINENLKEDIIFFKHNLLDKPMYKDFDIILCRNVLIYFSNEGKDIIFNNFSSVLKDEGILFLGPTEQIFNSNNFSLDILKPSFYIKQRGE